jgi:hypothetical protein
MNHVITKASQEPSISLQLVNAAKRSAEKGYVQSEMLSRFRYPGPCMTSTLTVTRTTLAETNIDYQNSS